MNIRRLIITASICVIGALSAFSFASCGEGTPSWIEQMTCNHEWDDGFITTDPTCTEEGKETITCEKCGKTKTEKVAKVKHDEVLLLLREATCEKDGEELYECKNCGELRKEVMEAEGHKAVKIVGKEATCTEEGLTDGVACEDCNMVLKEQETIPATGHLLETLAGVAPTCVNEGLTEGLRCTVCGETFLEQELIPVDKNAHIFSEYGSNEDGHWTICGECGYEGESVAHAGEWKTVGEVGKDIKDVLTCECGEVMNTVYLANVDENGNEMVTDIDLNTTTDIDLYEAIGDFLLDQTGTSGIFGIFYGGELICSRDDIDQYDWYMPVSLLGDVTGEVSFILSFTTGSEADGDLVLHDAIIKVNIIKTSTEVKL